MSIIRGHLVTLTDVKEATFVEKLTDGRNLYWIGARGKDNKYRWVTNEKTTYTPYNGWPDDAYGVCFNAQNGVLDGYWHADDKTGFYICEWDTSREFVLPDQVSLSTPKKASKTSVTLNWKKISDAKGYCIYMKTGKNGTYKKIKEITDKGITTYTKTKLTRGKTYYFRVRAYKKMFGEKSFGDVSVEKSIKLK